MVGTINSGNPNIIEDTKNKTGPTSEAGKFRASLNAIKHIERAYGKRSVRMQELNEVMKDMGLEYPKVEEALSLKKQFISWIKSKTGEELSEIQKLETIIDLLDSDMSMRVMHKLKEGIPLYDEDLKLIRLLKETLETTHRMKFGDKHIHAHLSYDDIRKAMFDDTQN